MSGWIKFEKDLLTDPRVLRIAKALEARWLVFDIDDERNAEAYDPSNAVALPAVTQVCGALVRIWVLADTHVDPNNVLPLGKAEIDEVIGIKGFCGILPEEWMREIDQHHVELPNFHEHNGTEAKKKAVTQKRVARHRARALHGGNGRALPDQDQTKTRPDQDHKSVKAGQEPPAPSPAPVELIPLQDGTEFPVTADFVAELDRAYPAVDIPQTLREIRAWNLSNPGKRKTLRGVRKHIHTWVAGEQQKAGAQH